MNDLTKETLGQLVANLLRLLAFSLLGLLLTSFVWAAGWLMVVGVEDVEGVVKNLSPNPIGWAQVAQSIGVFALRPWLYARFSGFSFQEFIAWKGEVKFSLLLQGLLLVFLGSSAGGEVMAWMQNGPWPDALQPLKAVLLEWDARSSQAVEALLKVNGAGEMVLILVALALVALPLLAARDPQPMRGLK